MEVTIQEYREHGWIKGRCDKYLFSAKVYGLPSETYGINGGRVSKLQIIHDNGGGWKFDNTVYNYDRGIDIRCNSSEELKVFGAILKKLEEIE